MENRQSEPAAAGSEWAASGFATALRNLQVFAEEFGRMSQFSFSQNAKLIDELGSARDVGEIVAIQTKFMAGMIETFNEQVRLIMSHMADLHIGMSGSPETLREAEPVGAAAAPESVRTSPGSAPGEAGKADEATGGTGAGQAPGQAPEPQSAVSAGVPDTVPNGAAPDFPAHRMAEAVSAKIASSRAPAVARVPAAPPRAEPPPAVAIEGEEDAALGAAQPTHEMAPDLDIPRAATPASAASEIAADEIPLAASEGSQTPVNEALEAAYRNLRLVISSTQTGIEEGEDFAEADFHAVQEAMKAAIESVEMAAGSDGAPSISETSEAAGPASSES